MLFVRAKTKTLVNPDAAKKHPVSHVKRKAELFRGWKECFVGAKVTYEKVARENLKNGSVLESIEQINLSVGTNEALSGATTLFDILLLRPYGIYLLAILKYLPQHKKLLAGEERTTNRVLKGITKYLLHVESY